MLLSQFVEVLETQITSYKLFVCGVQNVFNIVR